MEEEDFVRLTAPHRRALHVHCYRLLGSLHDADDALQETLLRAWRGTYEERAPLRAWLYKIATNVCLRMLEQRGRRGREEDIDPYPDRLLEDPKEGPDAQAEEREGVGLAFVAAMRLLPPRQRIVLVLRDVLDWPAREVAELLGGSVASVNSALQRARERVRREQEAGGLARLHAPASAAAERRVMRRFQDAWRAVDIPAIVALLADDAQLAMPRRVSGPAAIGEFFATQPLEGRLDRIELVPARANGQPALAAYADGEAYGVMVFAIEGERIAGITGFPRADLFPVMGLPPAPGAAGPGRA